MHNIISLKEKALLLRRKGKSYGEINQVLGLHKSTLSTWLKNLPLSKKVKARNINKAKVIWAKNISEFNKIRSEKYQKDTQLLIKKFSSEIPLPTDRDLFFTGVSLFWAEGGKREKWKVVFVNSDPQMIEVMMKFFRKICKVPEAKFILVLHLYPNIDEADAKSFWSKITGLNLTQFRKTQTKITISSKYKRPINRLPYGTLHISISDASLNKKMKGWILGLSQQINNMPG